jgi:glutaconate CoA-transferase subunit A
VLPAWTVGYVALAPGGAHPSYALGYSARDNDFYVAWDGISRDREVFGNWLREHVYAVGGSGTGGSRADGRAAGARVGEGQAL